MTTVNQIENPEVYLLKEAVGKHWSFQCLAAGSNVDLSASQESVLLFITAGSILVIPEWGHSGSRIDSGNILLVPAGDALHFQVLEDSRLVACMFSAELLLQESCALKRIVKYNLDDQDDNRPVYSMLPMVSLMRDFLFFLKKCIDGGIDQEIFLEQKKKEFFQFLFFLYPPKELAVFFSPLLSEEIRFKEQVIQISKMAMNVKDMASMANYSTSGFIKKFVKVFNEPPYQWILKQKSKDVLLDLNSGAISLKEIAAKYNFSSYQHFAYFCKKQYGAPPTKVVGNNNFGLK